MLEYLNEKEVQDLIFNQIKDIKKQNFQIYLHGDGKIFKEFRLGKYSIPDFLFFKSYPHGFHIHILEIKLNVIKKDVLQILRYYEELKCWLECQNFILNKVYVTCELSGHSISDDLYDVCKSSEWLTVSKYSISNDLKISMEDIYPKNYCEIEMTKITELENLFLNSQNNKIYNEQGGYCG